MANEKVEDVLNIGDKVTVKVYEIDGQGRINLTKKGLEEENKEEENKEEENKEEEKVEE